MSQRNPSKRPDDAPAAGPPPAEGAPEAGSPAAAHVPATLAATPTMAALMVALRRRWLLAAFLGVLCAGSVGAGLWTLVPASGYQAAAMVHIASAPENGPGLGRAPAENEVKFANFQKTQVALVKSQIVLGAALKDPQVASLRLVGRQPSPREWLAEKLEVDFKQGPEILRISMKGEDPEDMAVVVDAVMKAYLEEFVNSEESRRAARLRQLTELEARHKKIRSERRQKLAAFAPKLGGDPKIAEELHKAKIKQLGLAREELLGLGDEKRKLERNLLTNETRAKGISRGHFSSALVEKDIEGDPLVKSYVAQIGQLESAVDGIRKKANSPEAAERMLRERNTLVELKSVKATLDARLKDLRGKSLERLRERALDECQAEIGQTKDRLLQLDDQQARLKKTVAELDHELKLVGEEVFEMGLAARAVEEEEKLLTNIVDEIRALNLQALAPPRAKMLDGAVAAKSGDGKKKVMLTVGATGGTLALVLFGVGWWEFRKRKLESVDEVVCGFGINLVGTLPALPALSRRGLRCLPAAPGAPGSRAEAIDSFRTILLRNRPAGAVRVVMVTSAMPGEGKTSLSCHLAVSLAQSGRKTLLIDGDMRHPTAHRLFGLPRGPGFSEVLKGEADALDVAQPTPVPRLSLIPAGEFSLAAVQSLGHEVQIALFERLKQHFDVIVLDTCPVLPVADTLHLAQHVDGVIFSMLRRVSQMPKVSAALHRLRQVGTPVLGAVVNGTDEDVYGSRYYAGAPAQG